MELYYLGLKIGLFLAILRSFVKFEALQKHAVFLGFLYTGIIAGLSWVFFIAPQMGARQFVTWRSWEMQLVPRLLPRSQTSPEMIGWRAWQIWIVETFLLMTIYLRLLAKFDEGPLFWLILVVGIGLIFF